jgi:hypothetical protein
MDMEERTKRKKSEEKKQPEGGEYRAGTGSFYSAAPDESQKRISTNEPFTGGGLPERGSEAENIRMKKIKKEEEK